MAVQAIDPEMYQWTRAIIVDVKNNEVRLTWPGYDKSYDCWVKLDQVRLPVEKRAMMSRNAINRENFPIRKDPRYLFNGDKIIDNGRKNQYIVGINDPFKAEVGNIVTILY